MTTGFAAPKTDFAVAFPKILSFATGVVSENLKPESNADEGFEEV